MLFYRLISLWDVDIPVYFYCIDIFESLGNVILATDEKQVIPDTTDTNTPSTTTTASPVQSNQLAQAEMEEQKKQVVVSYVNLQ